jgi:hypothetical protein
MAINFPSSPTNGQTLVAGALTYVYNSTTGAWNVVKRTAKPFNLLVNPAFQMSQQNGNNQGSVSGFYPADQWAQGAATPQRVQRIIASAPVGPNGSKYYMTLNVITPKASLAAGDYTAIYQVIEGARMAQCQYGTASAMPMVLRFWIYATVAGTYSIALRSSVPTPTNYRGYAANYTISAAQINTWVQVVIPIPGDTATGITTWFTTTANNMYLWFTFAVGSTFYGTPNTWTTNNVVGTNNMSNGIATSGALYCIADAGLYLDPDNTGVPPPWQCPDEITMLIECQRYWYKMWCAQGIGASATTVGRMGMPHPVVMRATPQPVIAVVGAPTGHDIGYNGALTLSAGYSNAFCAEGTFTNAAGAWTVGRGPIMLGDPSSNYVAVSSR